MGPELAGLRSTEGVDPPVSTAELMAHLTGRSYDDVAGDDNWARMVSDPNHDCSWVVSMPADFTAAVLAIKDDQVAEVAATRAEIEEFGGLTDAEELRTLLLSLRQLAQVAPESGTALCCDMML